MSKPTESALEALPVHTAILDEAGEIIWTGSDWQEFAVVNDYEGDPEMIGASYLDVTNEADDDYARQVQTGLEALYNGDKQEFTVEYPCHSDSERRWFLMWASRVTQIDEEYVTIAHFDITDRKLQEQELARTADKLDAVVESTPDAIIVVDPEGRVELWNEGAEEMFGWDAEEVVGSRTPIIPPEKRDEFRQHVDRSIEGKAIPGTETYRQTRDGDLLDVRMSVAPIHDPEGEITGVMSMMRDISDQKEYEATLESTNAELEALNRILRHDIKNDIQVLLGHSQLLSDHVGEEGQHHLDKMVEMANHISELTDEAHEVIESTLSEDPNDPKPVALGPLLEAEIDTARDAHPDAAFEVDGEIPNVTVLAGDMLASPFRNLFNNAIQHNDTPTPTVSVSVETTDETVTVRVADDGPGVSDDRKSKIFGKGEQSIDSTGTGIGLYLVETVIENYGGNIRITDNEPRGTVFVVELDRA